MLFIRGFVYFAESVPVPGGSVGLNKTSVHTCRRKRSPSWCLLYKPLYKWVKHQDAGGLCTLEASPLFSHSACRRDSSRRRDGGENDAPPREKCSNRLYNNVVLLFFLLCSMRLQPSQTSLLRPSASLPTDSSLTPLCRALPQATPRNYSPMPQTGETGVCYTPHAELRKTTTMRPLFVNQTQGQKTKRCLPHLESITAENCRAKEPCIDLPSCLFTCF